MQQTLTMHTPDLADENFRRLAALFPNAVTETTNEAGEVVRAIDADVLRQEISVAVVEGPQERYQFTWPDKKKSVVLANAPIAKTLRLDRARSVGRDGTPGSIDTENLYIEGDNLDALKLLRETYLGKVKLIYIDPPYNTGADFIYKDDFSQGRDEYLAGSGQFDEEGNRLVQNTESNGRFHTDWLNMMYPRLRLAKDLLAEDGIIFISIDDDEEGNLKKCCDEIFGKHNCYGIITWFKKRKGSFLSKGIISLTEYILVYAKNRSSCIGLFGGSADAGESQPIIKRTNKFSTLAIPENCISTKLPDGVYKKGIYGGDINPVELLDDVNVVGGVIANRFRISAPFVWTQQMFEEELKKGGRCVINTMNFQIRVYRVYDEGQFKGFPSFVNGVEISGTNEDAYEELERLFGVKEIFDYSKPVNFIKNFCKAATHFSRDSVVMDFFSGSATTAHAVMQLNAEDGGRRKFILVQLPEVIESKNATSDKSKKVAQNAIEVLDKIGAEHTIFEIGRERLRRAAKKILEETGADIDYGFRVLRVDSTNMEDVYYRPQDYEQEQVPLLAENVKPNRTPEDLLIQVMLELGVPLSSTIAEEEIAGKRVFSVADGYLLACFDAEVTDEVVTAIARRRPFYAVLRDSGLASDSVAVNFEQIFQAHSPQTRRKVL